MLFSFVQVASPLKHFGTFSNILSFPPSFVVSLSLRFDEVSVKGDVNVHVVAVDGVLPLPLVKTDPDLVALL